jgi:hypothetical protein
MGHGQHGRPRRAAAQRAVATVICAWDIQSQDVADTVSTCTCGFNPIARMRASR